MGRILSQFIQSLRYVHTDRGIRLFMIKSILREYAGIISVVPAALAFLCLLQAHRDIGAHRLAGREGVNPCQARVISAYNVHQPKTQNGQVYREKNGLQLSRRGPV